MSVVALAARNQTMFWEKPIPIVNNDTAPVSNDTAPVSNDTVPVNGTVNGTTNQTPETQFQYRP